MRVTVTLYIHDVTEPHDSWELFFTFCLLLNESTLPTTWKDWSFYPSFRTTRSRWGSYPSSLPWCMTRSRGASSSLTWTDLWMTPWRSTSPASSWTSGLSTRRRFLRRSEYEQGNRLSYTFTHIAIDLCRVTICSPLLNVLVFFLYEFPLCVGQTSKPPLILCRISAF